MFYDVLFHFILGILLVNICNVRKHTHSHPEIEISFKFIPKILMSKECIHFLGHSVYIFICLMKGFTKTITRSNQN